MGRARDYYRSGDFDCRGPVSILPITQLVHENMLMNMILRHFLTPRQADLFTCHPIPRAPSSHPELDRSKLLIRGACWFL